MSDKHKTVKVTKIVIEIGDKKIELSPEEARELRSALDDTLGREIKEYIPYPSPYPVYPKPYYPYPRWQPSWVYYSRDTTGTVSVGSTVSNSELLEGTVKYTLHNLQQ